MGIKSAVLRAARRLDHSQPLFFLHVPKCGGTSVTQAIKRFYPVSRTRLKDGICSDNAALLNASGSPVRYEDDLDFRYREAVLLYEMAKGVRYITGHYCWSEAAQIGYGGRYKFITLVREPVSRYISEYLYFSAKTNASTSGIRYGIEAYLDSERGIAGGSTLIRYIGGLRTAGDYTSADAIGQAADTACRFDVIGDIADLAAFTRQVAEKVGINLVVRHARRSPVAESKRRKIVSDGLLTQIHEICRADLNFYAKLQKRWECGVSASRTETS